MGRKALYPPVLPPTIALAAAWCLYLPLSWQYLVVLCGAVVLAPALVRETGWRGVWSEPVVAWTLVWWVWMLLSAAWSQAPAMQRVSSLWHGALPLAMFVLAARLPPRWSRTALAHFVGVSAAVALLLVIGFGERVTGNQRIVWSLLLALAAAFAVIEALDAAVPLERAMWAAAALLCTAGLGWQDRRSGMLVLPLLLLAIGGLRLASWLRRAALAGAVLAAALLVWHFSPAVQARFEEGLAELRDYRAQGDVATSIGMRLRMIDVTIDMIRERPWFGHGAGSWTGMWRERVQGGGELLQAHLTPHNEYLLVMQQGGAVALVLFAAALGAMLRATWRRGAPAHAVLLVWITFVVAALFNAALRDAKLALPLMLVGALAWSRSREAHTS